MKNFQIAVLVLFGGLALFGILVFSGAIPIGKQTTTGGLGTVVLWGTVKSQVMTPLIEEFNNANQTFVIKYVQKSADTFDQNLLEALASGTGPDLILLPDDLAYHYSNKLYTIPYQSYPLSAFKNNFAGAGEVFLTSTGVLAFPLSIDPLVMYYNRSILDANGVVYPPATWDDMLKVVPLLTQKDNSNKITKSAVALGDFSNVAHAKAILSTLFMQGGDNIVYPKDGLAGGYYSGLDLPNQKANLTGSLKFYTNFSDPNADVYSWNKSFANSADVFSREDLAFYFGYASELSTLVNKNPNQNFLAASFPQVKNTKFKLTGAHVLGIALLSTSKNFNTALTAAGLLATGDFASKFVNATGVAPARRDLLKVKPTDAYSSIFYDSALYARSWMDPSPKDTDDIFERMIDGVLSNSMTFDGAINDASSKLNLLLIR